MDPGLRKNGKTSWILESFTLHLLCVDTTWPAASWYHALPHAMAVCPETEQNMPFLPFCHAMRQVANRAHGSRSVTALTQPPGLQNWKRWAAPSARDAHQGWLYHSEEPQWEAAGQCPAKLTGVFYRKPRWMSNRRAHVSSIMFRVVPSVISH